VGEAVVTEKGSGNTTIDSIGHIVRELKMGGLPAVAWTFVVCTAVLKQDGETLRWLWPKLYDTWVILIAAWAGFSALLSLAAWIQKRRELVPVIANPQSRVAPAPERAANG
jgi:hypothetical protein